MCSKSALFLRPSERTSSISFFVGMRRRKYAHHSEREHKLLDMFSAIPYFLFCVRSVIVHSVIDHSFRHRSSPRFHMIPSSLYILFALSLIPQSLIVSPLRYDFLFVFLLCRLITSCSLSHRYNKPVVDCITTESLSQVMKPCFA